jgi:glycosyltransferase involved in cell wall biosynthesis
MREVFIISTGEILNGKTAGSRRLLKIAKSLAAGRITVYLCSLAEFRGSPAEMREIQSGIFTLETVKNVSIQGESLRHFLKQVQFFTERGEAEKVIYLYPSTFVLIDFIYLLYFKYLKRHRFFCEINELRRAIPFSSPPPSGIGSGIKYYLKAIKDYLLFSLNELQVILYDGIVVISRDLGKYFSRYTKKILRVPILCDAEEIDSWNEPPYFDGETFRICFAGYIKCDKEGFGLLYEALSIVNLKQKAELYLYGILEDEDNVRLRQLSEMYGLNANVFYKGNIDPEILKNEFRKYHLLILPRPLNKRTKYGFSTKLSEYLVSGIPVLLTDVSDNALYIKDNYNGYIIPPGSSAAISEKLSYIIQSYNSQAGIIVTNAHSTVKESLDLRLFTNFYANFFFKGREEPNHSSEIE